MVYISVPCVPTINTKYTLLVPHTVIPNNMSKKVVTQARPRMLRLNTWLDYYALGSLPCIEWNLKHYSQFQIYKIMKFSFFIYF